MIKGRELLGKPVVSLSDGRQLEQVRELMFARSGQELLALVVQPGGWFRSARAIPFAQIRSIGEDAVMISSPDEVIPVSADQALQEALSDELSPLGLQVISSEQQRLGKVTDVYLDPQSGAVVGYEAALQQGKHFIPGWPKTRLTPQAVVVPPEVLSEVDEQRRESRKGGASQWISTMKKAFTDASKGAAPHTFTVSSPAEAIPQPLQVQDCFQAAPREVASLGMALLAPAPEQPEPSLDIIGQRIHQEVRSPAGSLVAAVDQRVTPAMLERAQHLGVAPALHDATLAPSTPGDGSQRSVRPS